MKGGFISRPPMVAHNQKISPTLVVGAINIAVS
jgi:hypothetical protein